MNPLLKILRILVLCIGAFTLARCALLLQNPQDFSTLSLLDQLGACIFGVRFDFATFLPIMAFPFLLLLLPFSWTRARWWQAFCCWGAFVLFSVLIVSLAGSVLYFSQARRHVADELAQLSNDFGFILPYVMRAHLGSALALAFSLLLLGWGWHTWIVRPPSARPLFLRHTLPAICLMVLGIRGSFSMKPLAPIDAYASGNRALGTLMLNGVYTASRSLLTYNEVARPLLSAAQLQAGLAPFGIDPQQASPFMRRIPPAVKARNIVVILLESWSHCYVDSFAHKGFGVTPFFDELAAKSTRYINYYANGTRSIEAIQLILSGVPPLRGLPTIDQGLDLSDMPRIGVLAEERGYESIFVQASKRRSFRLDAVAKFLGFGSYYGWEDAPPLLPYADPTAPQFGWDYESLMLFNQKLTEAKGPFFGFLFTGTTHTPFALPPAPCQRFPHSPDSEGGFLNTLCYADQSLREFFARSKNAPWFKDTLFILTADHTLGAYRHYSYRERQQVPLIIYDPRHEEGRDEAKFASHMDLFPTIISLMGKPATIPTLGEPLTIAGPGSVLITGRYDNIGLIMPEGYLVHSFESVVEQELIPSCGPECKENRELSLRALEHFSYATLKNKHWL